MSKYQIGPKNGQWKGGRVVASNGYILVRVGVGHHLADCRGYAYEHRVAAEAKIGRRLEPGEMVHHVNESKQDNRLENLEVVKGAAEHFVYHRKVRDSRRLPGESNATVQCDCGCGTSFLKYDASGRSRSYVSGHNPRPPQLGENILVYLETVPESHRIEFIGEFLDVPTENVRRSALRLAKLGKIRIEDGYLQLV